MTERVGVLGSGNVAQTLAAGFRAAGHAVAIGSRDPAKVADFALEHGMSHGLFAEVAAGAELVVLAVKGTVAEALVASLAGALAGKIVVDCTNPIADEPPDGGILRFFTGPNDSLMERLQAAAPDARFVKAWNSVGAGLMIHPQLPGGPPTMFICGDDAAAKARMGALLEGFGWGVEDVGGRQGARAIEPLCQLWCAPGFVHGRWRHAYRVLT